VRGLAVISFAAFTANGNEILNKLARVLGGTVEEPAGLLDLHTTAAVNGDNDTLAGIEHCILENPAWASCSPSGALAINIAASALPREPVDYLVCHELICLRVHYHEKGFGGAVASFIPNWREKHQDLML